MTNYNHSMMQKPERQQHPGETPYSGAYEILAIETTKDVVKQQSLAT